MPDQNGRRHVIILGGGVGGLTAAYEIACDPDFHRKYRLSVYQMGWRLGGKGASGRNPALGNRIEEHGLHIWGGYYDNAFDVMHRCLHDVKDEGHYPQDWREVFEPLSRATIMEQLDGRWRPWTITMPTNPMEPGKAEIPGCPMSYAQIDAALALLEQRHAELGHPANRRGARVQPGIAAGTPLPGPHPEAGWLDVARDLLRAVPTHAGSEAAETHRQAGLALQAFARSVCRCRREDEKSDADAFGFAAADGDDDFWRRSMLLLELGAVVVGGLLVDGVLIRGFEHLDVHEARDWCAMHGASRQLLESDLVRAMYDYVFAYPVGDRKGRLAAGTAMRNMFRLLFAYKGAFFYKLRTGMGDGIFAPLYAALYRRGVTFRFFHEVTRLGLADGMVESVEVWPQWQQRPAKPDAPSYDPLCLVNDRKVWPNAPRYGELPDGERLRHLVECQIVDLEQPGKDHDGRPPLETLRRGTDFDDVILAIPPGALLDGHRNGICQQLYDEDHRWQQMLDGLATVPTRAMQLWLGADAQTLGIEGQGTTTTGFADPFDTWSDMSPLLAQEGWQRQSGSCAPAGGDGVPRTLAYFCNVLPEVEADAAKVQAEARAWIEANLSHLWPGIMKDGGIDWSLFFDPEGRTGPDRLQAQHFRANTAPSDRYVLSVPGSTRTRLGPDDSGYRNLFLAGDWTRSGMNAGCVEGAAMSGLTAARAITGRPIRIPGQDELPEWADGPSLPMPWLSHILQKSARPGGEMTAEIATLALPSGQVQHLLPKGLRLLPHDLPLAAGQHPVVLLFGRMSHVGPLGRQPLGGMGYGEFAINIPFVGLHGRDGPFAYSRLMLDEILPVMLGILGYGYDKRLVRIEQAPGAYLVRDRSGAPLVESRTFPAGPARRADEMAGFERAWRMMRQPLIGRCLLGGWLHSDLRFDLDRLSVQPISGYVTVSRNFPDGVPAERYMLSPFAEGSLGAFQINGTWQIDHPLEVALRHLLARMPPEAEGEAAAAAAPAAFAKAAAGALGRSLLNGGLPAALATADSLARLAASRGVGRLPELIRQGEAEGMPTPVATALALARAGAQRLPRPGRRSGFGSLRPLRRPGGRRS